MTRRVVILTIAAVMLLGWAAPALAAAPASAVHETAEMQTLPGFVTVDGSSVTLTATASRASIRVETSQLVPGNVYTLWGFTFSHPENCVGDCGSDDSEERPGAVGFAVQQIAGHVTGASGNVNLGGSIAVENAGGAEYHIVVAEHGALDPANMPAAIKTPGPGAQIGILGA